MPLIDCFTKIKAFKPDEQQYLKDKSKELQKGGMSEHDAEKQVVREAMHDVEASMKSAYDQAGIKESSTNKPTETNAIPVEKTDEIPVRPSSTDGAPVGAGNETKGPEHEASAAQKEKITEMGGPGRSFWEHDVRPALEAIGKTAKSAVEIAVRILSPKTGVDRAAIDMIHGALGEHNEANAAVDKALGIFEKAFDKMPESDRINFIDRMKRGQKQVTPEMQAVSDVIKQLDKHLYDEIAKYNPSLPWLENHFRVLWKTIPGDLSGTEKTWSTRSRRPFQGSRGFMKKATLADMSEGINMGGEPQTTNPVTMFKLAYSDGMKYVTAQRMWQGLKDAGFAKFIKNSDDVPEGMVKLDDRLADVYFRTPEGLLASPGKFYVDEGAARLLNNHLSRDYFREKDLGQGLMSLKNLYTQVELGLSGFHAIAMGLESTSSQIGLGLRKILNFGLSLNGRSLADRGKMIASGLKDMFTSPAAAASTYRTGRGAIRWATEKDFESSATGKAFLKRLPGAAEYVHDFFQGGGLMKQHAEMKSNMIQSLKDQMGKDNLIGAALRALPALNEVLINPIFEHWIPALKVGMFMKEFPLLLKENAGKLASGEVTRAQLAQKQVAFIDDRLGEMNFDNLFWNRTFKTGMQFWFRSVTWKLGNLRAMAGAPVEQMMEFRNAIKNGRTPMLMPKMAWLLGLGVMQVGIASAVQKAFTGTWPSSIRDFVAPQINKDDANERVVMPTYWKDVLHMYHSPKGYARTSLSGPLGKVADILANKDFYGYEIHDPNAPWLEQAKDVLKYFAPKPFSVSSAAAMVEKGEPAAKVAMSFLGLNKAPGYLTHSEIENQIFDLYNIRNAGTKPKDARQANDAKKEIRKLYRAGKMEEAEKMADSLVHTGMLRPTQVKFIFQKVPQSEDATQFFFKELPYEDKKYLYGKMTDEEKKRYDPKGALGRLTGAIKSTENSDELKPWNPNE